MTFLNGVDTKTYLWNKTVLYKHEYLSENSESVFGKTINVEQRNVAQITHIEKKD